MMEKQCLECNQMMVFEPHQWRQAVKRKRHVKCKEKWANSVSKIRYQENNYLKDIRRYYQNPVYLETNGSWI